MTPLSWHAHLVFRVFAGPELLYVLRYTVAAEKRLRILAGSCLEERRIVMVRPVLP